MFARSFKTCNNIDLALGNSDILGVFHVALNLDKYLPKE
jgi:hypothetical protein